MEPSIAVLTIGNEILNGRIQDTNTRTIARLLVARGLVAKRAMTVSDDSAAIKEALLLLGARHHFVVVSGGLGPTSDDLTAAAAAAAFNRPLCKDLQALDMVRAFFRRLGRKMTERQEKQALLPQGAVILPNPQGSAPGFFLDEGGCRLAFLPGVPAEMEEMMARSVLPLLGEAFPAAGNYRQKSFILMGLPESEAEALLEKIPLPPQTGVAFCVNFPLVEVRLSTTVENGLALLEETAPQVRRIYGEHLVAEDEDTLIEKVARLLIHSGKSLALAESCTGGWIAKILTDIPGSSAFLDRSAVVYANRAKRDWLGVPEDLLENHGAVSAECALAMARGARRGAACDIGLAVTGIAGPAGGSEQKPVGTVFIALAAKQEESVERFLFPGNRDRIRWRTVCTALDRLLRHLLRYPT